MIERAFAAGTEFMVEVATNVATSVLAARLARAFDDIFASVGVHPHDAGGVDDKTLDRLDQLADEPGVVAIGETGLDFYRDLSPRDVQKSVFAAHIGLAKKKNLPLVVHIRGAYGEALDVLESEGASEVGGVLHCFSGDASSAERALEMGFFLGYGGTVTYEKSGGWRLVAVTPLKHMLLETDAPYLSPEPHRNKRNEPANVSLVLDAVAAIKETPREEVEKLTSFNARKLFKTNQAKLRLRAKAPEGG